MKVTFRVLLVALVMMLTAGQAKAGDFFYGLTADGANFWFMIPQTPVYFLNSLIGGGNAGQSIDWLRVKDDQGKIKVRQGKYFGFKAKDLFGDFGVGATFGYQPKFSVFGIYVNGGYHFKQFDMQPDRSLNAMEKYRLPSWTAGVGVRLTPIVSMLEDSGWSPIIELGTNYNQVFSVKAPYGNDVDQFGKGFTTRISAGVRFTDEDNAYSISLGFELPHYNYFNKDFTTADGLQPYKNIDAKAYSVSLKMSTEF